MLLALRGFGAVEILMFAAVAGTAAAGKEGAGEKCEENETHGSPMKSVRPAEIGRPRFWLQQELLLGAARGRAAAAADNRHDAQSENQGNENALHRSTPGKRGHTEN
jgi:hypothetical protein